MHSTTTQHSNAPHLRDYINVILRHHRLVLCLLALTVAGALCITFYMLPTYQAAVTLRVQAQRGQGGGATVDPFGDSFGMRRVMELDTELEILKSRTLAEEAVRHLRYQFQPPPSHNALVAFYHMATTRLPWSVDIPWLLPRQPGFSLQNVEVGDIPAPESYHIAMLEGGKFVVQTTKDNRDVGQGEIGHLFRSEHFAFLLQSQELQAGDKIAFALLPLWQATEQFQGSITVSLKRKTEIVEVTARAVSPTLARNMAMALAQAYIALVLQQKTQEASQILDFVERQLAATQTQLDASAGSLGRFKEQKGFVTLSNEAQATLEKITKFDTSLREIQSSLQEAEDLRRRLQTSSTSPDSRTIYAVGTGIGSQVLTSLADRLATLQVNLNAVRAQYTARHPAVLQAEQQVQSVKEKIMEELSTLITNLRSRAAALQDIVREYEAQLEKLPQAELELVKLTRQTTVNEDLYAFLLKKREETRIVHASTVSNVQIIDAPLVPIRPISPRKGRNLLLGVGLGLLLGVGVAFFLEYLDDSIKMIEDAEQWIGLPLLGAIPEIRTFGQQRQGNVRSPLLVQGIERGAAVEGFKSLRTNLQFLDIGDEQRKTLVITSPSMGDGKSTLAANLALYLGVAGHKSLLIDADLRRPSLARVFALASRPGLMEVLGGELSWREAVRRVGENVDFMSCGELPISPPELLASRRLRELLAEWEAAYDYVLFDVPPVLAVTDPVIIGGLCQGVLLVVRANKTSARLVKRTQAVLEAARVPIVGLVLNGLKSAYGYGYGYGYGYSYSENGHENGTGSRKPRKEKAQ